MLLHDSGFEPQNHVPALKIKRDEQNVLMWVSLAITAASLTFFFFTGRLWLMIPFMIGFVNVLRTLYKRSTIDQEIEDQQTTLDGLDEDRKSKPG